MIINKINTEYNGENLKTTLDVIACDCEVETLYDMVGNDVDICALCDGCCDGKYDSLPKPIFGGAYYNEDNELIYIEKVIYSKPTVIVFWSDGTKTKSKCDKEDIWNPELGLTLCTMKKIMGQEFTSKLFMDWAIESSAFDTMTSIEEENKKRRNENSRVITLKDVRAKNKERQEALELAKTLKIHK